MKLLLLTILLCGITSSPGYTAKSKKTCVCNTRATTSFEMVPSSLLFQF